MPATESQEKGSRDGLALIVGGLFVLALVFAAYNYFNNSTDTNGEYDSQENTSVLDKIKEAISPNKDEGDLNGDGAMSDSKMEKDTTNEEESVFEAMTWKATDYKQGDIKGTSYTVKTGDTLWEIAEGIYGNGAEWTKVLEANTESIGYLPNGSQALIVPGQVLVLP